MGKLFKRSLVHRTVLALSFSLLMLGGLSPAASSGYAERSEVQDFIQTMVTRHGFDASTLNPLFAQIEPNPVVTRTMTEQVTQPLPWSRYRSNFVNAWNIRQGVVFWHDNATALMQARQAYGVPEEVIVAIIGVESRYGKIQPRFAEFDTLVTLAFDYPRRAVFFRAELEQFLLLMREEGLDPLSIKGSFAGAMGIPQFMPSSYRSYAVDFNHDGHRDLRGSTTDAIGSVANYLKAYGWQADQPVAVRAHMSNESERDLSDHVSVTLRPAWSVDELQSLGLVTVEKLSPVAWVALLALEGENGREYWFGFDNFYAITRYNRSLNYALAVYQLSQEILGASKQGYEVSRRKPLRSPAHRARHR